MAAASQEEWAWGVEVEKLIDPILALFRYSGFGAGLASLIVAAGIIFLTLIVFKSFNNYRQIKKTTAALAAFDDEEGFARGREYIQEIFENSPILRVPFREFSETLIYPGVDEKVVRNTLRPQEFFNADDLGLDFPTLRIWSNIFVGVGLLLTFVGLVAALSAATVPLTGEANTEVVQVALKNLLKTASAKFYTSASALFVSIVLSVTIRLAAAYTDSLFRQLSDRIESLVQFLPIEQLAQAQLIELGEQSRQLKLFNTDLAMKIGERVETAVSQSMVLVTDKLTEISENLGKSNIEAMREFSQEFSKEVQGAAGEQLENLSQKLEVLGGTLDGLGGKLAEGSSSFEAEISGTLVRLNEGVEQMVAGINRDVDEKNRLNQKTIQNMIEQMSKSTASMGSSLEQAIEKIAAGIEETVLQIKQAVEAMVGSLNAATEEASAGVARNIEQAGEEAAAEITNKAAAVSTNLAKSFATVDEGVGRLTEQLTEVASRVTSLSTAMSGTTGILGTATEKIDTSVSNIASASDKLMGAAQPLLGISERMDAAAQRLSETTEQSETQLTEVSRNVLAKLENLNALWEKHAGHFDNVSDQLALVLKELMSAMEEGVGKLSQFVNETDVALQGSVTALTGAIEELSEERRAARQIEADQILRPDVTPQGGESDV